VVKNGTMPSEARMAGEPAVLDKEKRSGQRCTTMPDRPNREAHHLEGWCIAKTWLAKSLFLRMFLGVVKGKSGCGL
jgi:hypothetical protein